MRLILFLACLLLGIATSLAQTTNCACESFAEIARRHIKDWEESKSFFFFEAKMSIDADGSPRAYHPQPDKGLDNLSAAGYEGNWWALATDNGQKDGKPVIQTDRDSAPGYYVSMTSLGDRRYANTDPRRYVDAERIPYFVLPVNLLDITGARVGDFGYVYNRRTKRGAYAIFADVGGEDKLGEGSVYLAQQLGIPHSPRNGGQSDGVIYFVFPFSGNGQPRSLLEISQRGQELMERAEAFRLLHECLLKNNSLSFPEYRPDSTTTPAEDDQ